jgi:hypothetical protein
VAHDAHSVRIQCDLRVKRWRLKQPVEEYANIWKAARNDSIDVCLRLLLRSAFAPGKFRGNDLRVIQRRHNIAVTG